MKFLKAYIRWRMKRPAMEQFWIEHPLDKWEWDEPAWRRALQCWRMNRPRRSQHRAR